MNNQYGKALFELAKEDNLLQSYKDSFDAFLNIYHQEEDFRLILNSPKIKCEEKKDLIKNSFKGLNENFIYFLFVVLDNGRINTLEDIYQSFLNYYNEENKIKNVLVYSATKLTDKELFDLEKSLKNYYIGYQIVISNKIDTNVIGGYHILVNGLSIDLSVKHKIDSLKSTL